MNKPIWLLNLAPECHHHMLGELRIEAKLPLLLHLPSLRTPQFIDVDLKQKMEDTMRAIVNLLL